MNRNVNVMAMLHIVFYILFADHIVFNCKLLNFRTVNFKCLDKD